ncbi:MAG: hypothetical protein Q8R92_12390, partial [Deltaproteobacteria bacterium]|nr:hypothetical protein [Deltaproteobacteria bacterium]
FGVLLAIMAFLLVMGLVAAGLALVPLVQGGFVESRLAWRAAAMAHNVSTSGLIISFPAAIWFLATLRWWRAHFSARPETPGATGKRGRKQRRGARK